MNDNRRAAMAKEAHDAISQGNTDPVAAFVDDPLFAKTPTDRQNSLNTLLEFALIDKQLGVAEFLVARGADIHHDIYRGNASNVVTVFNHAASRGDFPAVLWLHERGAEINRPVHGRPASMVLLTAAHGGHLEVVKYLVEHGAVVNFVNGFGLSPLDYAERFQHPEVAAYLRSVGAKLGSELPRDHLPKDEPPSADAAHVSIREHLAFWFAGVEEFPLREITPGDPPLALLKVPQWDGGYVGLVTDGASARPMPTPVGDPDSVRRAEFVVLLPPDWPLDEAILRDPRHRWPIDWLCQVARWPTEEGGYYRKANIVANGDPPEPLGPECPMTCLLVRVHDDTDGVGRWTRPDGEVVELMLLTPLFTAERDYERKYGLPALLDRLAEQGFDASYFPLRPPAVESAEI